MKDKSLGDRVVGYYEFAKALESFTELIKRSTPEEIKVYNEIIATRPEFAIFINLARGLEPPNSALRFPPDVPNDDFKRSGLYWLMSLARTEFASVRSIFHNAKNPFIEVAPIGDEEMAYFRLLMDGFKTHYYHTIDSPELRRTIAASNNYISQTTLAYIRRLGMLADMYIALTPAAKRYFNDDQYREFKKLGREIHRNLYGLNNNLGKLLARSGTVRGSATSSNTSLIYDTCNLKCQEIGKLSGAF